MRHILFAAILLLTIPATAQTTISVNINQARLVWDWTQGAPPDDGVPMEFRVKCSIVGGAALPVVTTSASAREIPVKQVVSGPGEYSCHLTAANEFAESAPSNAVSFRAGSPPTAPSVRIEAK